MIKRILGASLLVTLTACLTSPPALNVAQADPQRGEFGEVYTIDGTQHSGELLSFDDSTVVLLTRDRVAIGSLSHVDRVVFDNFETTEVGPQHRPSPETVRSGRQASRFPYGITAAAMETLLQNAKQSAPDRLESMKP